MSRPPRRWLRSARNRLWFFVALATTVLAGSIAVMAPASASPANPAADENHFVELLNATRAKVGLPALVVNVELQTLSRAWAQEMASAGKISHANPISAGVTADWRKLGENVGTGGAVVAVMNAFIASPGHYANVVDPEFTQVGVGVVWVGNALYTTHRFMKVAGGAPSVPVVTTAPPPPPTAAPRSLPPTTTAPPPTTTVPLPVAPAARPERVAVTLDALAHATQ